MKKRLALCVLILVIGSVARAGAQEPAADISVDRLEFPVTLSAAVGAPTPCHIVGYLYYHRSYRDRPLQVVVHGATYNHRYWDFQFQNGTDYSYARYMAHPTRRFAVLAVDQLAAGESCRPSNGLLVTLDETASALNQVLDQLRSGQNATEHAFPQIALVGHSAGSINATYVQARWHPADALVVTAARHFTSLPPSFGIQLVLPYVPVLGSSPFFTLDSTLRAALFYYPPAADPNVIWADNASADQWTGGQVTSTFAAFLYPLGSLVPLDWVDQVTGNVLIQLGEFDALFPAGSPEQEAALWPNAAVKIQQLRGIGHNFNLHLTRHRSWEGIAEWLNEQLRR